MALEDVSKLLCHSSVAVSSAHPPLVFLVDGLLRCRRCPLPLGVIPCPLPPLFRHSVHFFEGSFPTGQLFQFGSVPPCFHQRPPFTTDHYSFVFRPAMCVGFGFDIPEAQPAMICAGSCLWLSHTDLLLPCTGWFPPSFHQWSSGYHTRTFYILARVGSLIHFADGPEQYEGGDKQRQKHQN